MVHVCVMPDGHIYNVQCHVSVMHRLATVCKYHCCSVSVLKGQYSSLQSLFIDNDAIGSPQLIFSGRERGEGVRE